MSVQAIAWVYEQRVGDATAKAVLAVLANYADKAGKSWPSHTTIAEDSELSRRTIIDKLAWLEARGWIKRVGQERRRNGTWRTDVIQIVFDAAQRERHPELPNDGIHVQNSHPAGAASHVQDLRTEVASSRVSQLHRVAPPSHVQITARPCADGARRIKKEPSVEPSTITPGKDSNSKVDVEGSSACEAETDDRAPFSDWTNDVPFGVGGGVTMATARPLRPHQVKALDLIRVSVMERVRRPLLQLPTGGGKTRLAAEIVERARAKGNRVVFVVPALSLIDQTVKAFVDEGIPMHEIGVIQADHPMTSPRRPIQIASVQTLERRAFPQADVVIIDEAHRYFRLYARWMAAEGWEKVPFIGLSATPWTKGLGKHFDRLLIAATMQELIDAGFLSTFRVFAPSHPDLTGVRTVAGDYHEGDLSKAMDKPDLVADVVRTWLERGEGRPTLCFAVDRAHAKKLQQQFETAGVRAGYVDAYTDPDEREAVRKAFHAGDLQVVCNVGVLTTGVDWDVRCIILARPTKSEMLYVQIVGRGLRTADGKADCLILDHSDTTLRLGFVTDIHHDDLDDGEAARKQERERVVPLPKECPKCTYLKPAKIHVCPVCSFAPERQSGVTCDDGGMLLELDRQRKPKKATPEQKAEWFAMLLACAQERGKSSPENWAAGMFHGKFKEWPHRKYGVQPARPTLEVRNFVKSRLIAYAMGQKKAGRNAA